ncbi:hypothetical protein ACMAZF_01335 [Psychrobium sp. nBUS_13]|uniref:hypothetical protein n=1 Tax=Psychrobium sp. nBUS_13 TaxID=3395319 RepID=UPI003EBAF0D4
MSNQKRYSVVIGSTRHINKTEAELLAVKGIGQATVDEAKAKAKLETINKQAFAHIDGAYPQWKQSNITRIGTSEQQATMTTFIDAVRAWANSDDPQHADLMAIKA